MKTNPKMLSMRRCSVCKAMHFASSKEWDLIRKTGVCRVPRLLSQRQESKKSDAAETA